MRRALLVAALLAIGSVRALGQAPGDEELVNSSNATTSTLALALRDAARATEDLRALSARAKYDVNPEETSDRLKNAVARASGVGIRLRPGSEKRLRELRSRTERLLAFFESDYAESNRRAAAETARLLGETMTALQAEVSPAFDANSGTGSAAAFPTGWLEGDFANPEYRSTLRALPMRDLIKEITRSRRALAESTPDLDVREACVRVAEAARELSTRADSLADSSRRPFRNAALRADVVAENIARLSANGDRSWRERQERLLKDVAQELESFLEVNGL